MPTCELGRRSRSPHLRHHPSSSSPARPITRPPCSSTAQTAVRTADLAASSSQAVRCHLVLLADLSQGTSLHTPVDRDATRCARCAPVSAKFLSHALRRQLHDSVAIPAVPSASTTSPTTPKVTARASSEQDDPAIGLRSTPSGCPDATDPAIDIRRPLSAPAG